jgi:hypothetical protein
MSDTPTTNSVPTTTTLAVRAEGACPHGYNIGRCPVDTPVWCPGGREIVLRETDAMTLYMEQYTKKAYVEVPDV